MVKPLSCKAWFVAPADELRIVARVVVKNPLIHQGLIHLRKKAFSGIEAAADSSFWNVMLCNVLSDSRKR